MASVSRAARVRRMGLIWRMRRTYAPTCGSVRRWNRPCRSTRTIPPEPGAYRRCSSSSAEAMSSRENRVVSSSWPISSGFSAANRSASTTARARSGVAKRAASASSESSVRAASRSSSSSVAASGTSTGVSSGTPSSTSVVKRHSFGGAAGEQRLRSGEMDLAVLAGLVDADELEPRHLEEREEGRDHAVPIAAEEICEEAAEGEALLGAQPVGDGGDAIADGEALDENLVRDLDLAAAEHRGERLDEPVDAHLGRLQEAHFLLRERKLLLRAAREHVAPELGQGGEVLRGGLVLLVLEEPADQLLARIRSRLGSPGIGRLFARQEHARLDVRERRRHY